MSKAKQLLELGEQYQTEWNVAAELPGATACEDCNEKFIAVFETLAAKLFPNHDDHRGIAGDAFGSCDHNMSLPVMQQVVDAAEQHCSETVSKIVP